MLIAQVFQNLRLGGIARLSLFSMRQSELLKEGVAELPRAVDVELIALSLIHIYPCGPCMGISAQAFKSSPAVFPAKNS